MSRIRTTLAVAAVALVALPATAQAKPTVPGLHMAYPHASRLCDRSDNANLPARLQGSEAQVAAACTDLRASFSAARGTFIAAAKPLGTQGRAAVRTAVQTCRQARADRTPGVCRDAVRTAVATLKDLRGQLRTARRTFRDAVRTSRSTFWATITALPGASSLTPDTGATPSPGGDVPADPA